MRPLSSSITWVRAWPDESRPEFRIGRLGEDVVAEWVGFATLRSDRTGTRCEFRLAEGVTDPMIADKFHRGQVQGLLRHLRGGLTIHGSAASLRDATIVLIGGSGVGKSSLIAQLCHKYSAKFVGDDTTVIEMGPAEVRAFRLDEHHWLDAESSLALGIDVKEGRWKQPIAPAFPVSSSAELAAVVNLRFDDSLPGPQLERLHGESVFRTLTMAALRFVVDEERVMLHDFEQIAELASRVPTFDLSRPRGVSGMSRDVAALLPLFDRTFSGLRGGS
jgi:hypothetical protein